MNCVTTSVFDIFKVGPGPSSSHTMAPMQAARRFRQACRELEGAAQGRATGLDVLLYGSLAATGKGHGTDRSVIGGLLGWEPETCDTDALDALSRDPDEEYPFLLSGRVLPFRAGAVRFDGAPRELSHPNTMVFRLLAGEELLLEKEYISAGGGFIRCRGEAEPARPEPPIPYANLRQLRNQMDRHGLGLVELLRRNETALSGLTPPEVDRGLDAILDAMERSVERGLAAEGVLPGPIGLARKATFLFRRSESMPGRGDRFAILLNAYALAASEENAAGHRVVTAPTSGSAGVIPGVVYLLSRHGDVSRALLAEGLLVAAAIGGIARHNASISGAEVGCQGEIGVASSMAAALICQVHGLGVGIIENAAEIALEHHLGLTCDPIGGYVQIPCIERNAVGAVHAYNAYLLASVGNPASQKIDFDSVVQVMLETGRDMSDRYKETARGGLARSSIRC